MPERDDELRAIEESLGENIRLGYVEVVGVDENGEITYRLTPEGKRHVEEDLLSGRSEDA
jgi:hypothetical protein